MDVNYHIRNLIEAREVLGDKVFTKAAALIYFNHYIKQMIEQRERLNRAKLQRQVNLSLREIDCEEVPYSFFRGLI